jgi:hypothetical protein
VSILHIESFENHGDEGLLAMTDCVAGAGAGAITVFRVMDFDAEELSCQADIGDVVFFREPGLDFDRSYGGIFRLQHCDVIDEQKNQNTITAEIEVGVGKELFEFKREQEGVNIVVPKSWCLFEAVMCFL